MGRTFDLGHWDGEDELTDRLHDYFERSGVTDWLHVAELGIELFQDERLHNSVRPLLYAVAGQAWEGALLDFAARVNIPPQAMLRAMRDVSESFMGDFRTHLVLLLTHGEQYCDDADCTICKAA